jgi:hypothetical protein
LALLDDCSLMFFESASAFGPRSVFADDPKAEVVACGARCVVQDDPES